MDAQYPHAATRPPTCQARGFTLVEILIVVIILGILAAIVIPQFGNATTDARTSALRSNLVNVRTQIELFKAQHGLPPDPTCMWTLMISKSDSSEFASDVPTGTRWGPYLASIPTNPLNNKSGISSANSDAAAGWYYSPSGQGFSFYPRDPDGSINVMY